MCTYGSNLFQAELNIFIWYLSMTFLSKLLKVSLQQHDNHVTHHKHFIQIIFQIGVTSLFILKELIKLLINILHQINITRVGEQFLYPLYACKIVVISAPIKSVPLSGTHVLKQYFQPVLCQIDPIHLPVNPAVHYTDSIRFNPERNEKWVKHVTCLQVFPEELQLIQISHILRLNVLVFVG